MKISRKSFQKIIIIKCYGDFLVIVDNLCFTW